LTLFFNVEFPPIEFASSAGTFAGMGADVIALVEGRLQKSFSKVPSDDWNRHLSALKTGECAIAPTIVRTEERERYAFFTTPYATVPVVIITTRSFGHGKTLDDLDGRRVAVVSGYATESYLVDRARGRFEVVPIPDVPHGLQAVSFGQVDAFVENLAVAAHYIDQGGIPNLRVAGLTDYAFAFSIGVSRKYPLLCSAVQKALAAIPETELEAIRKKWISLQVQSGLSPETKRLLVLAAAFTVLLVLGLTTISYFLKRRLREKVDSLRTAQQELAHSEARFRAIFDHAPYAIVINNLEDGRFLEANKAFLDSRDVNKEDMTRLTSTDLTLIGGAELKTISERLMEDGSIRNQEAHVLNKDGTHSHVMYSSVLLELQGHKQILSMTVDVTEKRQAERAL
jgi:PAS domain S-box-containing protein